MSSRVVRAIVIGAGIGGLATGIALRRAGLQVEVFERAGELNEVGAGISLWANALHALDKLGVGPAIAAASDAYEAAGLRSWDGRTIVNMSFDDLQRGLGVVCVIMHRAELQSVLLSALGRETVSLNAHCEHVQQDGDGVEAQFADGRRVRGDVLIGADGLYSVVRSALHGLEPPRYSGYTAWRAVVPFDVSALPASESWGYGARFGIVPMSMNRVYWFATENSKEGGRHANEKVALTDLFGRWHSPIPSLIEATPALDILRHDIYDRPVLRTWGAGRITLLGDAAHPMTPNLGQGACQALEDAVVLAQCLTGQPDVVAALRSYEKRRIPRANSLVSRSRHVGTIGQLESRAAVRLRDALFSRLSPRLQANQLVRVIGYRV
jgi:2-polyprenyl-6-methoxyphenol hydroxylase-like FAD-dependent oxidoreductase